MKFSRLMSAAAAAGLVLAPVAAEAGTRAADAHSYSVSNYASGARKSAAVDSDQLFAPNILLALLALGLVGAGVGIAASQSNG